jgi:hypothetical protein
MEAGHSCRSSSHLTRLTIGRLRWMEPRPLQANATECDGLRPGECDQRRIGGRDSNCRTFFAVLPGIEGSIV